MIQKVIEKFDYPVQSYRSCFGILRFAERYSKEALENCCHDALIFGKCSYNYISNAISTYADVAKEKADRMASSLKSGNNESIVTGIYKDDDSQYSLENLLKKQGGGDSQ